MTSSAPSSPFAQRFGLALSLAATLLAGCPFSQQGVPSSGPTELEFEEALAVTAFDPSLKESIPRVYLKWNLVPGAAQYELNRDGNIQLQKSGELSFVHTPDKGVKEGRQYTYTVRALGAGNEQKIVSDPVTITVLSHVLTGGGPEGLMLSPATQDKVTSPTPTISWSEVAEARAYYVKLIRIDNDSVVYSALAASSSIQVGKLPHAGIKWRRYPQTGEDVRLEVGKRYEAHLIALATDAATLAQTRAVDESDEVVKLFLVGS